MRDHDDKAVAGNIFEDVHDLHARLGVEGARGFVGEDDLRVVHDGARDGDALHLAAGHLRGALIQLIAEADGLERLDRPAAALGLLHAGERERHFDVGQDRLVGDEVIALKHKAHGVVAVGVPIAVVVLPGGGAVDDEVARGVPVKAADDVQQRRLAAAGGAEDGDEVILPKLQVNPPQGMDRLAAGLINFGDVFQFNHLYHAPI